MPIVKTTSPTGRVSYNTVDSSGKLTGKTSKAQWEKSPKKLTGTGVPLKGSTSGAYRQVRINKPKKVK